VAFINQQSTNLLNMKMKICFLFTLCSLIVCNGCKAQNDTEITKKDAVNPVFLISTEIEFQTIQGFGASDAWSCQFVGANWPDQKKNQIADLLFSNATNQDGKPMGIGLSMWRFNIGAGSAEQGDGSDIKDKWRRAECFMNKDLSYNWEKQSGQRWFLKSAKERGVNDFIAFLNSPPVFLTKNGKAYSSLPDSYNLSSDNYPVFVEYISSVLNSLKEKEGITFNTLSPFNEPQWDWTSPSQEGTPANNSEIAVITKKLNAELENKGIPTRIEIPEAGKINYLFEANDKPARGDQINAFFNPASRDYLGNLSHVAHTICGHSYFSTWDFNKLTEYRNELTQKMTAIDPDLKYSMTEYCLLEDNEMIKGNKRDLGMEAALYTARVIHADLTVANATSWQWWTAVSPYDYKDGLVYIDYNENDGQVYESKLLWALGNYSRFIRPGMKRVAVKPDVNFTKDVDYSAYKSADGKQLVFVINNYGLPTFDFKLSDNVQGKYSTCCYLTSPLGGDNLRLVKTGQIDEMIEVPAQSILTVVLEMI
jgi:hypothetical protein